MNKILFESKNFWVEDTKEGFSVNLKVEGHSYQVGLKKTLDLAKKLVAGLEKYPKNLKFLLPKSLQYQIKV